MKIKNVYLLLFLGLFLFSCASDDDYVPVDDDQGGGEEEIESPVIFDLDAVPYANLSDYNFFEGDMADLNPVYGVLPFELNSPLFTDYALKKRFVWMPKGVKAKYTADESILDFPVGAVLIKNFYYDHVIPGDKTQIIETRVMIKKEDKWIFANYIWNEEQTEAAFDLSGGFIPIEWNHNGTPKSVNYRIPAEPQCLMCHKSGESAIPIGPKPQNLNKDYAYADGTKNQLAKWEEMDYLDSGYPSSILSSVDYRDITQDLGKRVRSYFDINCGYCHSSVGHCNYRSIRLEFHETIHPENMGICVTPEEDISYSLGYAPTHIIRPKDLENSALYIRMNSDIENIKMPLTGTELIYEEAVNLVEEWINSLENDCN